MKFNTPLPQPLPKECEKAAKIFKSFVDSGNNGLDGVIPRNILENAKGFAIFTVFKAGFVFSARAGSGVVVAKLEDGTWSAPSAIGTAGLGVGGQAGAEMTDFLVVLNSRSAVRSFMAAGSLTLGGNLSIAVGPLGRNGEAIGSLNSSGKLAAMYSYSKTRGLFGGVSVEGSVIAERQDANAQAYRSDVTAKMLLSGSVDPPEWALPLTKTLEACTGLPGNHKWVQESESRRSDDSYPFGGMESPRPDAESSFAASQRLKKKGNRDRSNSNPYFDSFSRSDRDDDSLPPSKSRWHPTNPLDAPWQRGELDKNDQPTTQFFATKFESDFVSDEDMRKHPPIKSSPEVKTNRLIDVSDDHPNSPFSSSSYGYAQSTASNDAVSHKRSISAYTPSTSARRGFANPFGVSPSPSSSPSPLGSRRSVDYIEDLDGRGPIISPTATRRPFKNPFAVSPSPKLGSRATTSSSVDYLEDLDGNGPPPPRYTSQPKFTPKVPVVKSIPRGGGVTRAIALYDFKAVQPGDLSFNKGQVIVVKQMSDSTDTWWTGTLDGKEGSFPANFVEVV